MPKTFACPHCGKEYPHSASLIGRKVRCSACKNVIQLTADGSVKKISTEAVKAATAGNRSSFNQQSLTRRQKRQVEKTVTRSLERSRSLLNAAAKTAIDKIDESQFTNSSPQKKTSEPRLAANKGSAEGRDRGTSQPRIVRSSYDSKYQSKYPLLMIGCIILSAVFFFMFSSAPSPEVKALQYFASNVDEAYVEHPLKMPAYRDRMWLHTRNGSDAPPIVLNANKAQVKFIERVEWAPISKKCNELLGEMSLLRQFGMWVRSDKQVMVEKLWEEYTNKNNIGMFYGLLKKNGITFIHCEDIPAMLVSQDVSPRVVYIVSLLLAGTGDRNGGACRDFGLASDESAQFIEIYEFNGSESVSLVDKQDEYAVSVGSHYSGLIAGFISTSQADVEYRVIDIRFAGSMESFYDDKHNPLRMINNAARLRMMSEHVVPQAIPGPEMGVEE